MGDDDLFGVAHGVVTECDGVAVEDFPKCDVFRDVFVYKGEESVSDVGADIFIEG